MNWTNIILVFQILLLSSSLLAQNKQLEKANKRYQIKKYAEAIPLYEEGLAKNSSLSAKTKLAFCYRINNNIDKAAELYSEIVVLKKSRPITWYYYGETLMSQGKYEEAKTWLEKYADKKPGDPKGWALIESIDKVQKVKPYFQVNNVEAFAHNSESDDSAPVYYKGGIIFSSDRRTGMKVMKKKSGFTGRDFLKIYHSTLKSDGTFSSPSSISRRVNDMNKNSGTIAISPDGTYAVFSRNSDISNRKNVYNLMLYRADLTSEGKFKNVKILPFCNKNVNYMHPAFSADGNTLFFTSDKKGQGGTDIFYVTANKEGWSRPKNLGTPINTASNEGFPFMGSDDKLYFCSKGHLSFGGFDIFFSQKDKDGKWSDPINLGKPINSSADDISIFISEDNQKGMFASSREGGDDDIYFFNILGINGGIPMSGLLESDTPQKNYNNPSSTKEVITSAPTSDNTTPNAEKIITREEDIQPTKIVEKEKELPFAPIEPYQEKMETDIVTSTPSNEVTETSPSTSSKLPFEPIEPYQEEINTTAVTEMETIVEVEKIPSEPNKIIEQPIEEVEEIESDINPPAASMPTASSESFEIKIQTGSANPTSSQNNSTKIIEGENQKFEEGLASSDVDIPMTDHIPSANTAMEIIQDPGVVSMYDHLANNSPQADAIFVLEKLKFGNRKYIIDNQNSSSLDELLQLMEKNTSLKIEISSHTKSIGDDKDNMVISIKRATAVAGYLIRKGIGTDRVKVMGYGETQLLNHCSNEVNCSDEEHDMNQRIEIRFF